MTKTIVDIQVVDVEKRRVPSKHYVYVIVVQWTDNSSMVVYRRYSRFFDLQTQLLDKFPVDAGATDPSLRIIPFLPGKIFFGRSQIREVAMKRLKEIDEYCKSVLALPPRISQCEDVLEFFEVEPDDLDPPKDNLKQKEEKNVDKISTPKRLEQFTVVADYTAQEKGELDLHAGMVVEVTEKSESGWWFVNAEEHQGWVPSTYLQSVNGQSAGEESCTQDGHDVKYICIETFTANSADEISLDKGAIVEVQQKNMDGWWIVKFQGAEGYAPATYLKKSTDPYAQSLVEKSRQSGVKIIGNLSDVSNLMASSSSPRNSAILSSSPRNSTILSSSPQNSGVLESNDHGPSSPLASSFDRDRWGAGDEEEKDTVKDVMGPKRDALSKVVLKQRSLERGGSLKPPPRQNSVKQLVVNPPSPPVPAKPSAYITVADFEDTVGDGISFTAGETVTVLEKTSSGWWFVERGQDQGWVPESYLEPSTTSFSQAPVDSHEREEEEDDESEESEEEEETKPPAAALASALDSRFKAVNGDDKKSTSSPPCLPKLPGKGATKPPPPGKPQFSHSAKGVEEDGDSSMASSQNLKTVSGLTNALKSRFESKPSGQSASLSKPGPPSVPTKPGLPSKPSEKPSPPGLPSKPNEKPSPPGLPSKPSDKSGPPKFPREVTKKAEFPFAQAGKPVPPSLPSKAADKPGLPKKTESNENSSTESGVTAGLTSSLRSKFESQQQDNKPARPGVTPFPKPAPPSKNFVGSGKEHSGKPSFPNKPGGDGRPAFGQKQSTVTHSAVSANKPFSLPAKPSGPQKLPSKPQLGSKPDSDSNNNTNSSGRPVSSKVHSLAAAFGKQNEGSNGSKDTGSKPTLPGKKLTPPAPSTQKPTDRDYSSAASKPRVGNLVSELSNKLQFGGGGSGGNGNHSRSPEPSPVTKTAPWTAQASSKMSESSAPLKQNTDNLHNSIAKHQAPPPATGLEYEAVADFEAEGEGELCLQCGDIVEVVSQEQQDWWLVKRHHEEGWVPSSYLEPAPQWDD